MIFIFTFTAIKAGRRREDGIHSPETNKSVASNFGSSWQLKLLGLKNTGKLQYPRNSFLEQERESEQQTQLTNITRANYDLRISAYTGSLSLFLHLSLCSRCI